MSKLVHVELGLNGLPIRIFNNKDWRNYPKSEIDVLPKAKAVGVIRAQVFDRATREDPEGGSVSECEKCGRRITWESFHMNEKQLKSLRGQVSLENCEALCGYCHIWGPDAHHSDRKWQSAKIKLDKGQND